MKYLLSIPGTGGCYGATVGAAKNIITRIKQNDPNAVIHYSGVSSGAICALLMLVSRFHKKHYIENAEKNISQIHKEFIDCITESGKWSDSIFDYYHNNDLLFAGVEKFIRKKVKDVKMINNRLHIGYCKISATNKLEFVVVSEFLDVDDLINALLASSHYTLLLKNKMYHEYKGDKCVDGVFLNDNVHLPDYINIRISNELLDNISVCEKILEPNHEKFIRLYKYGKKFQKHQKINQFNITKEELVQIHSKKTFRLWDIVSTIMRIV